MDMREENDALRSKNELLRTENDALKAELQASKEEAASFKAEIEKLMAKISELEARDLAKLEKELAVRTKEVARLETENRVFRRPQEPRSYGELAGLTLIYRYFAPITVVEGAGGMHTGLAICREFKALEVTLTWENVKEGSDVVVAFMKRLAENVCAALNARQNMTVYFGVVDEGRVVGIEVEAYELVRQNIFCIANWCTTYLSFQLRLGPSMRS